MAEVSDTISLFFLAEMVQSKYYLLALSHSLTHTHGRAYLLIDEWQCNLNGAARDRQNYTRHDITSPTPVFSTLLWKILHCFHTLSLCFKMRWVHWCLILDPSPHGQVMQERTAQK